MQVYSTPPSGAAFPTGAPKQNLVAFQVVAVPHGGTKTVSIDVDPAQWETAMADGTRTIVPGQYTVAVGGHQPKDSEGSAGTSGACDSLSREVTSALQARWQSSSGWNREKSDFNPNTGQGEGISYTMLDVF